MSITKQAESGLSSEQRSEIRSAVLEAREMVEEDLRRELKKYGVYEDESMDIEELGHLSEEEKEVRRKVDAGLERELEATEDRERSYKNYVTEATKTKLNRLVALKALETRGVITETLIERPEYGDRSYLHRAIDEVAGELCDTKDGGLGVTLETAYKELSEEVGVLFEENEYTAVDIDFKVREDVIELLNDLDEEVWEADEAIGWVYQYFGENEREEIDERIDEENYKVQDTDIATKTQLFTPRYIVEWMVDNSLGRLWLEMRGDRTNIDDEDNCFYLAPLEESLVDREEKDVREIKVLDPACGSGHMLFYAFDVLYEMYLEEGKVPESQIPNEILKNNLYGIDIDPGVVQLTALSLYVKAKSRAPDTEVEQINVVPADAVLVNGEKKREVLDGLGELESRVVEEVWESFENIREYGSLVRIEEKIDEILEEWREEGHEFAESQTRLSDSGGLEGQSSLDSTEDEGWNTVKDELLEKVSGLAEEALEHNNPVEEMFADEVEKSVRLLDLFLYDYDVVVTNPPYLNSRKMGNSLKTFIKENYIGSRDTYTAFIERCGEFTNLQGYSSMITLQGFMFLYSYRGLRSKLLDEFEFVEFVHSTSLMIGSDDTVAHIMRNPIDEPSNNPSIFVRLVDEANKVGSLNKATTKRRKDAEDKNIYEVNQDSFNEIGRTPFIYWLGKKPLSLFEEHDKLGEVGKVKQGLATGDDGKFVRKYWEVPQHWLDDRFIHYQKSGTDSVYYDIPQDYVDWENDGEKIKDYDGSRPQNEEYYFKEGLTSRSFGDYFVTRAIPRSSIFGHNTPFIMSEELSNEVLMGILSSTLIRFMIDGINPGTRFEVGDTKQIPIKKNPDNGNRIGELASIGATKQKKKFSLSEISSNFEPTEYDDARLDAILLEERLFSDIHVVHGIIDSLVFDEYGILKKNRERIYENLPKNLANYPHITNAGSLDIDEHEFREEVPTKELPEDDYEQLIEDIDDLKDNELREISEELEVSPYTVAMVRHEHDLYTSDEKRKTAGRLLSYYLGCAMGRWELEGLEPDDDGIIVFDDGFDDNVMRFMRDCIELTYGEDELYSKEQEIEEMLNKDIEDWLRDTFFRYHHCKEYRRRGQRIPIYWQLASDEGHFNCFVYYHRMDEDTLLKVRGQYLDEKIDGLENRRQSLESQLADSDGDPEARSELEEVEEKLDDLRDFQGRLDDLIDEGFAPDFEAGIWENIQKVDEHDLLAVPLDKL